MTGSVSQENEATARGVITRLVWERGYGFIRGEGSEDIFFHRSALSGVGEREARKPAGESPATEPAKRQMNAPGEDERGVAARPSSVPTARLIL